ncbi:hypothetical protein Plhal304r1_c107g0176051 [Plasmopara halstedii]
MEYNLPPDHQTRLARSFLLLVSTGNRPFHYIITLVVHFQYAQIRRQLKHTSAYCVAAFRKVDSR